MKTKTSISLDPGLVDKAKQYDINISEITTKSIIEELDKAGNYTETIKKEDKYNTCRRCNEKLGWQNLFAVTRFSWSSHMETITCKDCLDKKYNDTDKTLEEHIFSINFYLMPMEKYFKPLVSHRLKQDLRE